MTLFALYDNVFSFTGHALWAALLAPSNLPGAAHGSQDLIYVWNLIDNLNIVEMYGDARCSNTGVVQKEDTLSLSLSAAPEFVWLCFVVEDSCLGQLENFSFGSSFGKCCVTLSLCSGTEARIWNFALQSCSQTLCRIMFFVSSGSEDHHIILQGCAFGPRKCWETKRSLISGDV